MGLFLRAVVLSPCPIPRSTRLWHRGSARRAGHGVDEVHIGEPRLGAARLRRPAASAVRGLEDIGVVADGPINPLCIMSKTALSNRICLHDLVGRPQKTPLDAI
jgi:hypothetical protein